MKYKDYIWLAKMADKEGITPKQMQIEIHKRVDDMFKFQDNLLKIMGGISLLIVIYLTTIMSVHDSIKLVSELVVLILAGWLFLNIGYRLIDRFLPEDNI